MKLHRRWAATTLFVFVLSAPAATNAALVSRLNGAAVYDTDLNITWLANANANGPMTWSQANAWVTGLTVSGFSGWRLPSTPQLDSTCTSIHTSVYFCAGSEMGHLYYKELGGIADRVWWAEWWGETWSNPANVALFQNIQPLIYWSGTEYAQNTSEAWAFHFGAGTQFTMPINKGYTLYALAVRPGDVTTVPVPAAAWLFGSGLVGLIGFAPRKKT